MVAGGGPAATNLGRLANGVSTSLGFRAPGSVTGPDSPRPYLSGGVDADLRAAAAQLGVDDDLFNPGSGDYDTSAVTAGGLRNVGQTLGRQVSLHLSVRLLVLCVCVCMVQGRGQYLSLVATAVGGFAFSSGQTVFGCCTCGGIAAEEFDVGAVCYSRDEWTS